MLPRSVDEETPFVKQEITFYQTFPLVDSEERAFKYCWPIDMILLLVAELLLLLLIAADQLKEACIRQMAAEIRSVTSHARKQHLLLLPVPQQSKQRGKAKQQQQHQERLEQALAEYKQVKQGCDAGDPGNLLSVRPGQSLPLVCVERVFSCAVMHGGICVVPKRESPVVQICLKAINCRQVDVVHFKVVGGA
jgi:hypothetical protein